MTGSVAFNEKWPNSQTDENGSWKDETKSKLWLWGKHIANGRFILYEDPYERKSIKRNNNESKPSHQHKEGTDKDK